MSAVAQSVLPDPQLILAGDRMSRDEFIDRWNRMPGLRFAELIDGTVYMPSPHSVAHSEHEALLGTVLGVYAGHSPGCRHSTNGTWLMTRKSAPQPDQALRWIRSGRSRVEGKLLVGVPDLAVEVCVSSRSYDMGPKLRLYESAGVPEYLAALVEEQRFEWRILEKGRYRIMRPHRDGTLRSKIFPGLWLDTKAFWKGDTLALLATLQQGLAATKL